MRPRIFSIYKKNCNACNLIQAYCFRFYFLLGTEIILAKMVIHGPASLVQRHQSSSVTSKASGGAARFGARSYITRRSVCPCRWRHCGRSVKTPLARAATSGLDITISRPKMITVLTRYRPIVFELICSRNACNFSLAASLLDFIKKP